MLHSTTDLSASANFTKRRQYLRIKYTGCNCQFRNGTYPRAEDTAFKPCRLATYLKQ
ncbi:uncharacterized protein LOC142564333 isoform X2 [Dermacentor variabilis]|uniref:uncharacterized protein LOC142564333 isoform X2 n=1 Tax=Dermacentor variabilis TaxID=34621 RepID=UPI003F5C715D